MESPFLPNAASDQEGAGLLQALPRGRAFSAAGLLKVQFGAPLSPGVCALLPPPPCRSCCCTPPPREGVPRAAIHRELFQLLTKKSPWKIFT